MSVNPIGASFVAAAQNVASGGSGPKSAVASAVEEANESKTTTIKEAQNGDRIAQRKLQALQAKQQANQPAPAKVSEPGKGSAVDHDA